MIQPHSSLQKPTEFKYKPDDKGVLQNPIERDAWALSIIFLCHNKQFEAGGNSPALR